jgi:iron complex outermembrane receptor protein
MSKSSNQVSRAVRRALIVSAMAASAAAPAMAQDQPAAPEAAPLLEVIVTGSRIKDPNLISMSPISTVSAADIQNTGFSRVEDVLNNLPMVFAGQNSTVSNGADGTATVDLRGLGPERTLVLVNGRRLGPGFGDGRNFSDINQIPAQLIERVDVLTGGESSVYGADAVAGVVNFVLNTHFQGIKVDANYSFYQHHNNNSVGHYASDAGFATPDSSVNTGFGKNVSVLMGSNFADNRGNATFYATYDRQAATLQGKYDYSACTLKAAKGNTLSCGGSGTSAKNGAGGYFQAYGGGVPLFTNTVDGLTGAFRPFDVPGDLYNYGPLNFYQRPNERWTAGSFINFEVNDHLTAYGEAMFTRNTSQAQIAPSGDFFTTTFIPCNDPLLTAEERGVICSPANLAAQGQTDGMDLLIGRRNVEGGGRIATFDSNTLRILTGLKGDIADGWSFDVYAQQSTVDSSNGNLNYFSAANVANALNVVTDPATGQPACQSAINGTDTLCVPWNIWKPNGVTKEALNYLQVPLLIEATTTERVVSGSVTGDLGKYGAQLPTADHGLQVNVGAEWRSESADFNPDYLSIQGNAEGAGGATLPNRGSFNVRELFTEINLPIANKQPWADSLTFNAGYRWSDYSEGFKTNTYMGRLEWAPIGDVRLRMSYQRAVRAPNILELFGPQSVGLDGSQDPCAGAAPVATQAQCTLAGVSAAQYGHISTNPAGQYNGFIGGNAKLQPEKADTYSAGVVFTPHWVDNLSISMDYYNIKVSDVIGPVGADTIALDCVFTGNPQYCGAIHRDENGSLWKTNNGFVTDPNVNLGSFLTRGLDFKTDYRLPLAGLGNLSFHLEGTKLIDITTRPLKGFPVSYNCEGLFGTTCGASQPSWRHVLSTTWSTPWDALDITLRWRYLGSASSQQSTSNLLLTGNPLPLTEHIPAYNYIDMTARFKVYKSVMLQLGVNNLADKDPPIIPTNGGGYGNDCPTITTKGSSCNGNTFPGTYDALGRFIFAHVSAQF